MEIRTRHRISWYDSLIVAAAVEGGCSVLYSEDLSHGMKIRGVTIENPFR
jgi:predicted nucleic acid-binding protein